MDFATIIKAVIAMAGMALVLGAILAVASIRFHVEVDEKVQYIWDILPGANCGACGFPSCEAAAEGIAKGDIPINACMAGGQDIANKIAEIMGQEAAEGAEPMIAAAKCGGGKGKVKMRYRYEGIDNCHAAQIVVGGPLMCNYGCLGYGDCVQACPFDALEIAEDKLPRVDKEKCTACGICVTTCPRDIMALIPTKADVVVKCSSKDKGKTVKAACKVGCIACKACEKACEPEAIKVIDNLAVIDYEKCENRKACVEKCPTKCIVDLAEVETKEEVTQES